MRRRLLVCTDDDTSFGGDVLYRHALHGDDRAALRAFSTCADC
ncbi:MAG TPA: hypothetical protein VJN18_35925 [Polyangiaceae bacterium]|nr:hypothetical protein [Polyangiaceae bacterium]